MKISGTIRPSPRKWWIFPVLDWTRCAVHVPPHGEYALRFEDGLVTCLEENLTVAHSRVERKSLLNLREQSELHITDVSGRASITLAFGPRSEILLSDGKLSHFDLSTTPYGPSWCRGTLEKGMSQIGFEIDASIVPLEFGLIVLYLAGFSIVERSDGGIS